MAKVRVQSEQYPSTTAPRSTTTRVPVGIGLRSGTWWGIAPLGPAATMTSKLAPLRPGVAHHALDGPGHRALLAAGQPVRGDRLEGPVGHGRRLAHPRDLLGLLAHPQVLDHAAHRHQLDQGQGLGQPGVAGEGHVVGLDAHAPAGHGLAERRGHPLQQVAAGLHHLHAPGLGAGADDVA